MTSYWPSMQNHFCFLAHDMLHICMCLLKLNLAFSFISNSGVNLPLFFFCSYPSLIRSVKNQMAFQVALFSIKARASMTSCNARKANLSCSFAQSCIATTCLLKFISCSSVLWWSTVNWPYLDGKEEAEQWKLNLSANICDCSENLVQKCRLWGRDQTSFFFLHNPQVVWTVYDVLFLSPNEIMFKIVVINLVSISILRERKGGRLCCPERWKQTVAK